MQGVLLFLNPEAVSEDVVALGLLPQVVELDQLTHRPGENIKTDKMAKGFEWSCFNLQSRFHLFK